MKGSKIFFTNSKPRSFSILTYGSLVLPFSTPGFNSMGQVDDYCLDTFVSCHRCHTNVHLISIYWLIPVDFFYNLETDWFYQV